MPMDFSGIGDRVRSLVAAKKPTDLARSTLTPDELRDNIIAEEATRSTRFKNAIRSTPQVEYDVTTEHEDGSKTTARKTYDWTAWPEMMRDVARASFGYDEPEVVRPNEVRPAYRLNQAIMDELARSEGFMESRPYTRGNEIESLFNALAVQKSIREQAPERLAEHVARAQEAEEQEEAQSSAMERLEDLRERAKLQHDAAGQIDPSLVQEIKDQTAAREAAKEKLGELAQQQAASTMVMDAAAVAREAAEKGAEAVAMFGNLPGVGGSQSQHLSPDEQIELAEMWAENPDMQRIADMLGRLQKDMRFKRETRTKNVAIEPVGITAGRDFERMLPTELARALSPNRLIKATFMNDYAQASVLQVDMQGKIPAGKGPIIVVTDGSGSMKSPIDKFIWATSLALALLTIAQRESRHFAGIQFSDRGVFRSWQFPAKKPVDPREVLDYASHFFGGGTNTATGVAEALRIIDEQAEFSTADVILIADGQDHFLQPDKEIRDALRAKDVRIHGLSILTPGNKYMSQMCEWVRDVTDLAGSNDATDGLAAEIT